MLRKILSLLTILPIIFIIFVNQPSGILNTIGNMCLPLFFVLWIIILNTNKFETRKNAKSFVIVTSSLLFLIMPVLSIYSSLNKDIYVPDYSGIWILSFFMIFMIFIGSIVYNFFPGIRKQSYFSKRESEIISKS